MFASQPGPAAALPVAVASSDGRRLGYDATPTIAEARIRAMLRDEAVVWLSTVRRDGLPNLVPTWFWWDGEALLVFSKPDAAKVANLRANPRLMVALGRPDEDFDVGLIEAEAAVLPGRVDVPAAFFAKYRGRLAEGRLDVATFRATYTQAIRIVPVRFLSWHGRGERHDVPAAGGIRARLGAAWQRIAHRPGPSYPRRHAPRPAVASLLPAWA